MWTDEEFEPSKRVIDAMRAVPRADFLPEKVQHLAHYDGPLPIGHGQTNSQPYTVALMLTLLDVHEGQNILDVGAGSGWTTALLANLVGPAGNVCGVERQAALVDGARGAIASCPNAQIRRATPGVLGLPDEAPFDRILVSATAAGLPKSLVDQLGEGGVMVIPVGTTMKRVVRRGDATSVTDHGLFQFVPLIED